MSVTLPVALLAGGLATRLLPLTGTIPKSLVEVAGKPFIFWQLALFRAQGVKKVVICAGHLGEMIQDAVKDGEAFGLAVRYSFDGPSPLGTAGALKKALPLLGGAFFVVYGDSYLNCDYAAVERRFHASGQPALMTVYHNRGKFDASNVVFRNGAIKRYDKKNRTPDMEYIDYGLGVFSSAAFLDVSSEKASDLADVYMGLLAAGQLAGFEAVDRFYEIGSFAGIEEMSRMLLENRESLP